MTSHLKLVNTKKTMTSYVDRNPGSGLGQEENVTRLEEFEDTKGVIRICKSKDRQHHGQKKKYKRTNNNL